MGCLSCKHAEIIENTNPHFSRKESRWRCVVGLEAKGLEFNAQIGMVHSKLSDYKMKNLQIVNNTHNRDPSITTIEELIL